MFYLSFPHPPVHPAQHPQQPPDFFAIKCFLHKDFTIKVTTKKRIILTITVPIIYPVFFYLESLYLSFLNTM